MGGGETRAGRGAKVRGGAVLLVAALALAATGCGRAEKASSNGSEVIVSASTTLKNALSGFEPGARYGFGRSDELVRQINQPPRSDVFASDGTQLPQQLASSGRAEKPVTFAAARLVVVVPHPSGGHAAKVQSFADLSKHGVKIAAAPKNVQLGSYTRQALGRLPRSKARAIEANVKLSEPTASAILTKLAGGAVDAGIIYMPDAVVARNRVRVIPFPKKLRAEVPFAAVVIKKGAHLSLARAYVKRLREPTAQRSLKKAGFDPPQ